METTTCFIDEVKKTVTFPGRGICFVSLDFETMTSIRTSACAVGLVKVINGIIVQRFFSLMKPVPDKYLHKEPNTRIHGISLQDTESAPDFNKLFPFIKDFIEGLPLVCHNKGADIPCLVQLSEYHGLSGIDTENVICTYYLTGLSLEVACKSYDIPLPSHHDALCDAEACARLFLNLIDSPLKIHVQKDVVPAKEDFSHKHLRKDLRIQLDPDEVENKSTVFFQSKVVITGTFEAFPNREELAEVLQKLGAKINQGISKKTTHVVMGMDAGPKKIEKVMDLKNSGVEITVISESALLKILEEVGWIPSTE